MDETVLETGATARTRNGGASLAVVMVNGGTARSVPGTWSATSELVAAGLAPSFPDTCFVEVRYRLKTWKELEGCTDDACAAIEHAEALGANRVVLIGFSMGGAVSLGVAGDASVAGVIALAPWIPDRLSLDGVGGLRFDVLHGSLDRNLPGIPGVSPAGSRRGFERALAAGAHGSYHVIPGGLHGAALRRRNGKLFRLPRWRAWLDGTKELLTTYAPD